MVVRAKDNTRQWAVYLLRDYPHTAEEASLIDKEGWVLRTKLKTALKEIGLGAGSGSASPSLGRPRTG